MNRCSIFFTILLLFTSTFVSAQKFNQSLNKDSLLRIIYQRLGTEEKIAEFKSFYDNGNNEEKEFLLFMGLGPRSSKKELIDNAERNLPKINNLISEFNALVPKGKIVYVEFNPANDLISEPENIDIRITYNDPDNFNSKERYSKWNLKYGSSELKEACKMLNWSDETLSKIKSLLVEANCISIENNHIPEIGFARSGMAKYSYLIFEKNLDADQVKTYNNGCTYIYYKNNIVLEFGGGAVGPQCFPKDD